jgi:hypothetical protein
VGTWASAAAAKNPRASFDNRARAELSVAGGLDEPSKMNNRIGATEKLGEVCRHDVEGEPFRLG